MVHFELWCITQSAVDEKLVRDALHDALISDYPVPNGAEVDKADSSPFHIFVSRLVITVCLVFLARYYVLWSAKT